jgi:xanthine phosphoribosyltransferase
MHRYYYSYDEFKEDISTLKKRIEPFRADTLLSIARGGMLPGLFLAEALDTRRLFTLNAIHYDDTRKLDSLEIFNIPQLEDAKRILVIDDIIDSGDTVEAVMALLRGRYPDKEFALASIFYKKEASVQPDYSVKEAKGWIDFFWEADPLDL